jgi:hypothetical protein
MSLRFQSQLMIDNLPDEQLNDQFEVIMPELPLMLPEGNTDTTKASTWDKFTGMFGFGKQVNYRPIVEEITFGTMNFSTDTRRVRTGWLNVPSDIENWHDVAITMFCPASMATHMYLNTWKRMIFNRDGEYYNSMSVYKKNITVLVYGPAKSIGSVFNAGTMQFTLKGCFPKTQEDFKFEYSDDPKRFRVLAHFSVDKVEYDEDLSRSAIIAESIASPTQLFDKLLSTGMSPSDYRVGTTYGTKNTNPSTPQSN